MKSKQCIRCGKYFELREFIPIYTKKHRADLCQEDRLGNVCRNCHNAARRERRQAFAKADPDGYRRWLEHRRERLRTNSRERRQKPEVQDYHRQYRKAREEATRRLQQMFPHIWKQLLEEEKRKRGWSE